jgi:hypothetical protein
MYVLLMRDGSRQSIAAADLLEAMRETVRSGARQLEVGDTAARVMTSEQALTELELGRPGLFDSYSSEWQAPSPAEFRELLRVAQLSGSQAGQLVGVKSGRIRKWAGGDDSIPYAVWRLLSIYVGLAPAPSHEITK